MRIALAMINCNRRDGHGRAVNEVAERLVQRGHDVHLYARKVEDLDLTGITWHRIGGPGRPEIANFWTYYTQVNSLLKRHNYDIVHAVGCNTLAADVITIQNIQPAKRKILTRFGSRERVSPGRRFTRWLHLEVTTAVEKKMYTRKTARRLMFLPVSRGVEGELRQYYDIGDSVVRIIPNAANTTIFRPIDAAKRAEWRQAHGLAENHIIAVFTGGEWSRKGLDLAIGATARMTNPDFRLFVAGDDVDRARFIALAADAGAKDRVIFGGFQKDIATAMAASDIFLFPSHYEAFSLATIEAAASGLPVVASRINGSEDFVQPGETGYFIEPDAENIAHVLEPLVASASERIRLGGNARRLVEAQYTWDRVADATEEAYQDWMRIKAQ